MSASGSRTKRLADKADEHKLGTALSSAVGHSYSEPEVKKNSASVLKVEVPLDSKRWGNDWAFC